MGAKLTHSLDIINSFGELKIVVPLTTAQVPATLEVLKARKQHYLDERAKVRNAECMQGVEHYSILYDMEMMAEECRGGPIDVQKCLHCTRQCCCMWLC